MSMESQVNKMCRNVYFNIRNISKIRKFLSKANLKTVVNALVTPHMDYGNSLLYRIPKKLVDKLQVAQNSAVRLIEKLGKYDNVSAYRRDLHWLPIPARIKYKILTTTWKIVNNQAPNYLKDLVCLRENGHDLRNDLMLTPPDVHNHNDLVDRAFFRSAPSLWNSLPNALRKQEKLNTFKKNLKTHLFKKNFN